MSGVATAVAVGGSAVIGYIGSQQAAKQQSEALGSAINAQESMFGVQQAEAAPYREAGTQALSQISQNMPTWNRPVTMQDLQMDPGFAFRLAQGQGALTSAAGAGRGVISGGELAALTNYSQQAGASEYQAAFDRYQQQINNAYNRLSGVAGLGLSATGMSIGAGTAAAGNIGQSLTGIGQSQAAGTIGATNAVTGALGTGANLLATQGILSKLGYGNSEAGGGAGIGDGGGVPQPGAGSQQVDVSGAGFGPAQPPPMDESILIRELQ